MATTAPPVTALSSAATVGGKLHGGSQPVTGATVTLYYAGKSGYGSGVTQGGSASVAAVATTDATGAFSFNKDATPNETTSGNSFSCPISGPSVTLPTGVESDPLVYVIARGGNTLNTADPSVHNDAAAFLGVFGLCSQISASSFLDLNEVTTVATMAALQQYFNPVTESIGTDGIGAAKLSLVNTLSTISNLANVVTGTAVASTQRVGGSGDGVLGVTVTATAPADKINQIANILAACVNNASASATPCTTLFDNANPPNVVQTDRPYQSAPFPKATDTVDAAYYMLTNPTNGGSANLQKLFDLAAAVGAPFQPALSVVPADWSIAIAYSSSSACGSSLGSFINAPQDINIDANGNLWIANGQATTGNLSSITFNGTPLACVFLGGGNSRGSTIDTQGNIWYGTTAASNIYRYNPFNRSVLPFTTAAPPLAVTADGAGNVYFSTAPDGSLYQIAGAATALTASTPTQVATGIGALPTRLIPDKTGAIWATSGSSFISQIAPPTATYNTTGSFLTTTFGTSGDFTYGIAITNNGNVVVSSGGANNGLSYLTGSGLNFTLDSNWPTSAGLGGLNNPTAIAVDPQFNIWAPNNTGVASISEISISPINLAPFTSDPNGFQQGTAFAGGSRAVVIDMSGNVWVAGDGTLANPSNLVTEIVGAGAPVYQPYAKGLSNGRFQSIP
ncbi:MAG TPA: hypothetical protein VIX42_12705 [Edaphobacter sp.]